MYIQKVQLQQLRGIADFTWELAEEELAGWHVLIGANGSGKSTLLKAISLALIGEQNALALRQNWNEWIAQGSDRAQVELQVRQMGTPPFPSATRQLWLHRDKYSGRLEMSPTTTLPEATHRDGGFSAAFGPFRRFMGSDKDYVGLMKSSPRLAAHLSIFGEDIAFTEALEWLKELHHKHLEGRPEGALLGQIQHFINQPDFLPHQIRLASVSSDGVLFKNRQGVTVAVEQLSDGFRSILSLTFELIRQLSLTFAELPIFDPDFTHISPAGVILIDEIDAHLHPEWQRQIGFWLTEHFPRMQFIVTTHSPLVCQAASRGSIWRLPTPGRDTTSYRVDKNNPATAEEWKRLVYGNILEAYSTDLFGENIDRSPEAQSKFQRVAELSAKEMELPLSPTEATELAALMAELPETPYKRVL
jgi:predicted ATPase